MVKLVGRHHVKAMRAFVRRKQVLQERQLAREKEAALPPRELPEYDPDDNGRFAGYDAIFKCEGRHYEALCRLLKKILRPAHYRTWLAANGELVNDPAPCLSAKEIAERVGRHRRTIEIDLQEMREKRLLHLQPAQREGRWVMEMHYDVLYRLVHEYLEWERSADYIPPERQYFERMEIDADLRQRLLQFEDYRKVLAKKKPGPKGRSVLQETYPVRPTCPGSDRQHTYSDAPILPAASQGGMKRSVNLEPSAPPVLPQAGVSGSIPPVAPAESYDPEAVVSSRCQQEDSPMQNTYENDATHNQYSNDYTRDGAINDQYSNDYTGDGAYIYRALLPPPMQEVRMDRNGTRSIFLVKAREVPHLEDEQGTLYFAGSIIPQLYGDLMARKRKEYFITMAEFGPEIVCLFDADAIGAAVSLGFSSPEVPEEDEIVMRVLFTEPDEDEPQEDAGPETMAQTGANDDEDTLKFAAVWTPKLQLFLRHEQPGLAYFVPLTDFPPEEQRKIPEGAVGLWVWKDPETWQTFFDACFEWYLEGIKAQPEFDALTEANARYHEAMSRNALPTADGYADTSAMEQQAASLVENAPAQMYAPAHTVPASQAQQTLSGEKIPDESLAFSNAVSDGTQALRKEDATYGAPAIQDKGRTIVNSPPMLCKDDVNNSDNRDEAVRREAYYEKETEKLRVVTSAPPANQGRDRRAQQGQPGRPAGRQDHREVSSAEAREQAAGRQHADVHKKREDDVSASSVFSYGSREIVHGGAPGVTYPAIVPLLQGFMQKKLLGGDTATRYFIAYERLGVPHIGQAFPPGTDGVWIWCQGPDRSVHVKPTCSALDPALKNRNLALLSVAVGRLSDDDGSFYFYAPPSGSASGASVPPGRQNGGNDRRPREAPAGTAAPANEYGGRRDGHGGKVPVGTSPANEYGGQRDGYGSRRTPVGAAHERGGRGNAHDASASTEASTRQQGQDKYRTLLKRAKDGNGRGLQRIF
jgi:hypothetical protein